MTAKEMAKRLVTHQGKEKALQMSQELAKVSLLVKQNKGGIEFNDEIEAAKKKKAYINPIKRSAKTAAFWDEVAGLVKKL